MEKSKSIDAVVTKLRKEFPYIQQAYGVESLSVFGSYSRGEQRVDSDLDILVTFNEPPGFFRYIRLENHLSDVLGVDVDLVMKDALKSRISRNIAKDIVPVA